MASPMRPRNRDRATKTLGVSKTAYALNPDFGYFNSQVSDKNAFSRYLGAPAGEQTQLELQELSEDTTLAPGHADLGAADSDTKPVKVEKENAMLGAPTVLPADSQLFSTKTKRARVEDIDIVKTEETIVPLQMVAAWTRTQSDSLRISQLENEVAVLRREMLANQEAAECVIQGLQHEWKEALRTCVYFQNRVGGFGVRMNRVEGHVDEIVAHLPSHRGWRSEVGSDFDPDTTLADIDFEDSSQPMEPWTHEQDWSNGSDVDAKKEVDV